MKKIPRMIIIPFILFFCINIYADEDIYVEEYPSDPNYVETSSFDSTNLEKEVSSSNTKVDKYEYEFDIYPYVSVNVKYTSEKTIR